MKVSAAQIIGAVKTPQEDTPSSGRPARFLLAMPDKLRYALNREATIHGRTVTSEINMRLQASLHTAQKSDVDSHAQASMLSALDRQMLEAFRAMPAEKQLALLALLT